MNENRIGALQLRGKDAIRFANSFYHPTAQDIREHEAHAERINNSIYVSDTCSGFVADIDGLDLSFLDDEAKTEQIVATVRVAVRSADKIFCCNEEDIITMTKVEIVVANHFSTCNADDTLSIAA